VSTEIPRGVQDRIRGDIERKMRAEQLTAVVDAATEVIAQIRSKRELIPEGEREQLVFGLRQLGRCAFHLAEDLAVVERAKK
jgi:hypothetical protein